MDATDPVMQKVLALVETAGRRRYAEGFRAATRIIALAVGQLEGESRAKLADTLDRLESELHAAEAAGK
jgi:hypothetical protein